MFCKIEGCNKIVENRDLGLCSSHARQARKGSPEKKKPNFIKQISSKKIKEINEYTKLQKEYFKDPKNRICKVCKKGGADSIHHSKGKVGFADNEARLKGITLLNDVRFWVPIHSFQINHEYGTTCHRYIEDHPEFARKIGVTSSRLS